MTNLHDRNFKALLENRPFLENFIRAYVPPEVVAKMDWNSLELYQLKMYHRERKTRREFESDVVYFAKIDQQDNFLWIHCEHQSDHDRLMFWRILQYQTAEILNYLENHPSQEKAPPMISIVYHQGKQPWGYSFNLADQFTHPELGVRFFGKPILVDLPMMSDQELERHDGIDGVEKILKYVRRNDLDKKYKILILGLKKVDYNSREIALRYLLDFLDIPTEEFIDTICECLPDGEISAMNVKQQWIQEGRQAGWQEGRQEGLACGLEVITKTMSSKGLSESLIQEILRISAESLAESSSNEFPESVTPEK